MPAGLSVVVCILIVVLLVLPRNGQTELATEEGRYPELAPGEKLPDISNGWGRPGGWDPKFEFKGSFPKMPSKMLVYKTVAPTGITEQYVREFARKYFAMPADAEFRLNEPFYNLKTQSHHFMFTSSWGFFELFKYEKAREKLSEDRKDYPSDEDCKKIATQYLKQRGLLPEDAYLRVIADHTKSAGGMTGSFGRIIGKYKTWGPGSKILVRIGVDGEIIYVSCQWLQLEPYKLAPIITPQEAFEQLKQGNAFLGGSGKITKITLRYDTPPGGQYVQPVYYFQFAKASRYAVVPAIKQEHLLSAEETRKYMKQKAGNSSE